MKKERNLEHPLAVPTPILLLVSELDDLAQEPIERAGVGVW
jgi:hypothetical protein